jgi:hypothetical protein
MKKIKVKYYYDKRIEGEEIITLPIFRMHDVSGDYDETIYYEIVTESMIEISIKESRRDEIISYEIERKKLKSLGYASKDYLFGLGEYKLSKEEFFRILEKAKTFLNDILKDISQENMEK